MKKHYVYWIMLFATCLLMVTPALAQEASSIPQVTIQATSEGLVVPEEMPGGIVQITVENNSEAIVGSVFARLNEGVSFEDFGAAMNAGDEGALGLIAFHGVMEVAPGAARTATLDLMPGEYILLNWPGEIPEEVIPFTVADAGGEAPPVPEADVEVTMIDFAYTVPIEIPAGPQRWHIQNRGTHLHDMLVLPLDDNMSAGAFNELLQRALSGDDEGVPEEVAFWVASPGTQGWIAIDLEPGTYALICTLPDMSGSGRFHADLGMRQTIIVTE